MKKIFSLVSLAILSGVINFTQGQCVISDQKILLTDINTSTCEVTFDLTWTQDVNIGNKYAYIHIWSQQAYHTPAANWLDMYQNTGNYPVAGDLVNALATIVIDGNSLDNPVIGTEYHPDPSYVLPQQSGLSVVKVHLNNTLIERMTIKGIRLTLPACTGAQILMYDIWASQAQNGKNVHCATQNGQLVINEIKVNGNVECTNPRQFRVTIQNTGPQLENVCYKVYLDYPPMGIMNPDDTLVFTSAFINLPGNGVYISPLTDYLPYSGSIYSSGTPLLAEVIIPARPNTTLGVIDNFCGRLPVTITYFNVVPELNRVVLKWQTASEYNNRGFEIQRSNGLGGFATIAFVPSQAANGNSNTLLDYRFTDLDRFSNSGRIFYRLKQNDFDGRVQYSETRYIDKLPGKTELLVYPNPANGPVEVVLPADAGKMDVHLADMGGRLINRWVGITANRLSINNLKAGVYMIKVYVRETGETLLARIMIQ
ncbi:MAG: T9SS type A sorting domain-containing protein [Dinghuibacter sp.]|nr:T9SS type A sorting domain-containing protein [Dinghuibacter sp.]